MMLEHVGTRQPGEIAHAAARVAHQRVSAMDDGPETQIGTEGGIFQVSGELGGDAVGDPAQGFFRKGRAHDHVGKDLDRQWQVFTANPH